MFLRGGHGDYSRRAEWHPRPGATENPTKFHQKFKLEFHWFFNRFGLPFGIEFGPNFDRKSKKIRLESIFEQTSEKYTF